MGARLLVAVFDRTPGGIAITDMNGRFARANAPYPKLVGYTKQELAGLSMETLAGPEAYAAIKLRSRDFEPRIRIPCKVTFTPDVREPAGLIAITLFRISMRRR